MNSRLRLLALSLLCSVTTLTFAQPAQPVYVSNTQKISATVKSVDVKQRLLELTAQGQTTTIQVPDEVRNLPQIKPGDEVVVTYHEGIAAEFKKKGDSKTIGVIDATTGTSRTKEGSMPGAAVGRQVTTTVVIEAVDRSKNALTFTGPSGMTRTVDVKDPKAQQFISQLQKGDEVELTYTEALAVTVERK